MMTSPWNGRENHIISFVFGVILNHNLPLAVRLRNVLLFSA